MGITIPDVFQDLAGKSHSWPDQVLVIVLLWTGSWTRDLQGPVNTTLLGSCDSVIHQLSFSLSALKLNNLLIWHSSCSDTDCPTYLFGKRDGALISQVSFPCLDSAWIQRAEILPPAMEILKHQFQCQLNLFSYSNLYIDKQTTDYTVYNTF